MQDWTELLRGELGHVEVASKVLSFLRSFRDGVAGSHYYVGHCSTSLSENRN
jgi:hypothetical protein